MTLPEIHWQKLLQIQYWLEGYVGGVDSAPITPPNNPEHFFFWFWLNVFSIVFSLGVVLRVLQAFLHERHPLQKKLPFWGNNAMWIGTLGLLWFFSRQTETSFLGIRIWLIVFFIWGLVIFFLALRYLTKYYPFEINYFKREILKIPSEK